MYRRILGLTPAEPGYRRVRISPDLACGLTHAQGSYESVYGQIRISWALAGDTAVLDVELSPCVEAEVAFGNACEHMTSGSHHFETTVA